MRGYKRHKVESDGMHQKSLNVTRKILTRSEMTSGLGSDEEWEEKEEEEEEEEEEGRGV